jgi:hypothetical protein
MDPASLPLVKAMFIGFPVRQIVLIQSYGMATSDFFMWSFIPLIIDDLGLSENGIPHSIHWSIIIFPY